MVVLLAACSGQTPNNKESVKKDSVVTARDVALEKKAVAEKLKDSLTAVIEEAAAEEAELAEWVMAHAVELKDDAPEVMRLNRMRMHLDSLRKQLGLADGQVRYLERVMGSEK